jgi:hypothetical protein
MAGTAFRISGPAYLANAAANIYTPPASTILIKITQIVVANKTASAATFTLYIGATGGSAGGTELLGLNVSVPANSSIPYFFSNLVMKSTDFLTGLASAASTLTITVLGTEEVVA